MHALLHLDTARIMISDRISERAAPGHVVLDFTDVDDMARRFDALAKSGTVEMAIHDAFWGDKFGALRDKRGVQWLFTCAPNGRQTG